MPFLKKLSDGFNRVFSDFARMELQTNGQQADPRDGPPSRLAGVSATAIEASHRPVSNEHRAGMLAMDTGAAQPEPIKGNRHVLAFKAARKAVKTTNNTIPNYLLPRGNGNSDGNNTPSDADKKQLPTQDQPSTYPPMPKDPPLPAYKP
ncbi:hypothetical protein DFQ26_008960 [Actinomortierella ambigua]|nr:hypothetical protein DFQ26_008960 [Actinomortierella ambigua]